MYGNYLTVCGGERVKVVVVGGGGVRVGETHVYTMSSGEEEGLRAQYIKLP
jgi:hypothetical protein